jgi:hypothetical protein
MANAKDQEPADERAVSQIMEMKEHQFLLQRIGATIATATEHVLCEPLPDDWLVRIVLLHVREQAPKSCTNGTLRQAPPASKAAPQDALKTPIRS